MVMGRQWEVGTDGKPACDFLLVIIIEGRGATPQSIPEFPLRHPSKFNKIKIHTHTHFIFLHIVYIV